jgi:flagellar hook protein FlgE
MFNSAISGLRAATNDLSVVSNNVANASTTGFKSSRALFADMCAANSGPSNAVGMGVKLAGTNQLFNQGSLNVTNNILDLAIDGQGFFGVNEGGTLSYTRAGAFGTDRNGYIVNMAGQRLRGYLANQAGGVTSQLGDLRIDTSNMPPSATLSGSASLNLDAGSVAPALAWPATPFAFGDAGPSPETYNSSSSLTIHDSLGNPHTLSLYFARGAGNTWDVHTLVDGVTVGATPAGTLQFDANGVVDPATAQLNLTGWQPLDAGGAPNGAAAQNFTFSLADATQFGSPFTVHALDQDGYAAGEFSRIGIDASGVITSYFSNGQSKALGQVALYNFANPQGLQQLGDSAWAETPNSGPGIVGMPETGALGAVQAGALEESNVDVTAELVHLILAQRNYQANAKTIQTADTVTQTIMNLR